MSGTNKADIVFVLDASSSMEPCIEGVKRHISSFADVFRNDPNNKWDLRFDFIAHDDTTIENRPAGIDKDFRERVISAGGAYDDVDVRFSLIWNNRNDLDLHVIAPSGEEIYFGKKKSRCRGMLDVDRNVGGQTRKPVENVRWLKGEAPDGLYRVFARNFTFHEPDESPTSFRLESFVGGELQHFDGLISKNGETREDSDINVGEFRFTRGMKQRTSQQGSNPGGFRAQSLFEKELLKSLYGGSSQGRCFTEDVSTFQTALAKVETGENEAPLVALDCALDFPWRDAAACRRIVILMTDEPVEGGNYLTESKNKVDALVQKIHTLKVLLYMVTPESEVFERLSAADKSEWDVVEGGDGLAAVDFSELLNRIAKSISKSQASQINLRAPSKALFGQDKW